MIIVRIPATSANLGSGFDSVGLALNIYNEFSFEKSNKDDLSNFSSELKKNNMVLNSYKFFFKEFNLEYIPVKISPYKIDVPTSRGLGSSSTAIVAGLMGANYISGINLDKEVILNLAAKIEGHPDNVAPAIMGGLVTSYKADNKYKYIKYPISVQFKFYAMIPEYIMSTEQSRLVLPDEYSRSDVVYNLSRAINLLYAFASGDIELLKEMTKDRIHEMYRIPLIPNAKKMIKKYGIDNTRIILSGSGSTLLAITSGSDLENVDFDMGFHIKKCVIDEKGAVVYEI